MTDKDKSENPTEEGPGADSATTETGDQTAGQVSEIAQEDQPVQASGAVSDDVVAADEASGHAAGVPDETTLSEEDAGPTEGVSSDSSATPDESAAIVEEATPGEPSRPDEPSAAGEPESQVAAPPKAKGRVIAVIAFLFALGAFCASGYLYYLLVYLDPIAQVTAANQADQQQLEQLQRDVEQRVRNLRQEQASQLAEATANQAELLADNEDAVRKSLQEALLAAPPSQREWKLAEAEYLMRIANHRVLMEQDSRGALVLLQAADQIIQELDDFALHGVRARLADEMVALRQVPSDDLQGIYLRLEAMKSLLDALPFNVPEYLQQPAEPEPEMTVWQQLGDALKDFVRVRSVSSEATVKPLLAPEEEQYLELNLRLSVEQAQLAALKRHQAVYEQALTSTRDWVERYLDVNASATVALLTEIEEMIQLQLAHPLPDISGSLNELLSARRGEE